MSVVIRRPVRLLNARIPNVAVLWRIAPVSVVVQIFIPNHILRNILSGPRMFPTTVAVRAPGIKLVVIGVEILYVRVQLIGSREHCVVMGTNGIRRAAARNLAFSVANSNGSGVPALINVDAIDTWSCNRECQVRRINFVRLVPV
jgi:hypothetical protein